MLRILWFLYLIWMKYFEGDPIVPLEDATLQEKFSIFLWHNRSPN